MAIKIKEKINNIIDNYICRYKALLLKTIMNYIAKI